MKRTLLTAFLALALGGAAAAQAKPSGPHLPAASKLDVLPLDAVAVLEVPEVDRAVLAADDERRERVGLPPRYAVANEVAATPFTAGTLEGADGDRLLWRLRVLGRGADSINLGFLRYRLPASARLLVHSPDGAQVLRPFTAADNEEHGQLWTPLVLGPELVIELLVEGDELGDVLLELGHVGYGYRGFGAKGGADKSGSCNVDVVCPIADDWRNEIPAVGVISTGGSTFCTGFLVNNTANDQRPYFMTANHCGIGGGNAASLVVYWNYETSLCGGAPDGQLAQFSTGSLFRASWSASDFTLVELDDPLDPAFGLTFAGWDRSGADVAGAIAIHHPSTDEKRISFEYEPTSTTSYLSDAVPGNGTHVRVDDWDVGTTEGGSSGSPLFDPDHRVIGQLHGGFAACGNDSADWYGKLSVSWTGGGTPSTRLSDWLDPLGTGAVTLGTLGNLSIPPGSTIHHEGPVGGPFTDPITTVTLSNATTSFVDWRVSSLTQAGMLLNGGSAALAGTLAPGASADIELELGFPFALKPAGVHTEQILFEDLTNDVSSVQTHVVEVGRIPLASFPMNVDPGWITEGLWAFGPPQGGGGSSGNPDPTSGATGANVMGYNLAGDYANNLQEESVTTRVIDCSGAVGVRVRYRRWLNVETSTWDHAYFRVSADGVVWHTVWENAGAVTDSQWVDQEFDISAIADGQTRVQLRWTMGKTDGSLVFSGWNVDDVVVTGVLLGSGAPKPRQFFQQK